MKRKTIYISFAVLVTALIFATSCKKQLDEPAENRTFTGGTDYSKSSDMIKPLIGTYSELNKVDNDWVDFPTIALRGDDVNAAGDQNPLIQTDLYNYDNGFWNYKDLWEAYYRKIFISHSAMEQIALYKAQAANAAAADQYTAEAKTLRAWWLFQLSRVFGGILLPTSSDPTTLFSTPLSTKEEVMQHISDQMDEAIPLLPDMRPNQRTDIPGGVTKYTALAIKALANLELKNYQKVADATADIIKSQKFTLESDYYNLFKIPGKLNNENLLEMQYSDLGTGAGDNYYYLMAFFGPTDWTPKVAGAGGGWGFFEPSFKYIKFMIARGERKRLETSVLFTPKGIDSLKKLTTVPAWVSNTTPSGDVINNSARLLFLSGKHYLPSDQLTNGRKDYGTNKNFTCIRYAEILLMYAEALKQGATGSAGTADDAVNTIRGRAGLSTLSNVTIDDVMNEKFAELAMEWGTRYYDMLRLGRISELNYDGRTNFTMDKAYLPYPQAEIDLLPVLKQK